MLMWCAETRGSSALVAELALMLDNGTQSQPQLGCASVRVSNGSTIVASASFLQAADHNKVISGFHAFGQAMATIAESGKGFLSGETDDLSEDSLNRYTENDEEEDDLVQMRQ
ncbi:hypothetical protein PoB_001901300 [Plakobranchus ocellatus]|uniref:Uncharacterized protein n=1 Tax=Plakobranchus ocellatus TaxID=259542 RepID=A0AAV3ZCN8_9GAST|nr:hypothetical protein PoB_001901300 [Plakobranchus ocellatus]